jgi:hypothetical protein
MTRTHNLFASWIDGKAGKFVRRTASAADRGFAFVGREIFVNLRGGGHIDHRLEGPGLCPFPLTCWLQEGQGAGGTEEGRPRVAAEEEV